MRFEEKERSEDKRKLRGDSWLSRLLLVDPQEAPRCTRCHRKVDTQDSAVLFIEGRFIGPDCAEKIRQRSVLRSSGLEATTELCQDCGSPYVTTPQARTRCHYRTCCTCCPESTSKYIKKKDGGCLLQRNEN